MTKHTDHTPLPAPDGAIADAILQRVEAGIEKIVQQRLNEDCLWGTGDIARYLNTSQKTVQNGVVNKDSFPRPIRVEKADGRSMERRWNPKEVKAWALRHKC